MKKRILKTALFIVACTFAVGTFRAHAEEQGPSASADIGVLSKYVWRGEELSNDSIVIQPSVTVGYKGFSVNLWGNLDTARDDNNAATADTKNWTETDFTMSYEVSYGLFSLGAGYIYYGLDNATDTDEIYVSAGYDCFLSPTLTVYRDIGTIPRWYLNFGLSYSVALPKGITLDLSGSAGYYISDDVGGMPEVDANLMNTTKEFRGLNDGVLSAGLTIPVNRYISISPMIAYSFPLSSDAKNRSKQISRSLFGDDDSDYLYGGAIISIAF